MAKRDGIQGPVRREIEEMFGFVPEFYETMPPAAIEHAWGLQRSLQLSDQTALDNKTKELIGLAVAAHIKCRYCTYFHDQAARMFGANDDEIREAIAMGGLTVLYSNALTGGIVDYEDFTEEVDRALDYVKSHPKEAPRAPSTRPRA